MCIRDRNVGDSAVVAGVADDSDGMFLFSRGVTLQGLADQSGYTRLQLEDGSYPLSELDILPIACSTAATSPQASISRRKSVKFSATG